jgi:hypothetical protein
MPENDPTVPAADKWRSFGHVVLRPEDAVECGWSRDGARAVLAAAFPGRDGITAADARAALASAAAGANGASDAAARLRAAALVEEIVDYRAERARIATEHQAIRHAKVNLKKLLKSPDVSLPQLRALAQDLGWHVREDEEGVTVPVNELIPFFRRPVVRALLAAKMRQVGLAPPPEQTT